MALRSRGVAVVVLVCQALRVREEAGRCLVWVGWLVRFGVLSSLSSLLLVLINLNYAGIDC